MNEYVLLYNAKDKDLIFHVAGTHKPRVEWLMENGYVPVGEIKCTLTQAEIKAAMGSRLEAKCNKLEEGIQKAFKDLHEAIN